MNKILYILLGIVVGLHQGTSKEFYELNINERGTPFTEAIEIDGAENTVLYKVPSHNDIEKTDVLVDYENGHAVTKIVEKGVCYLQLLPGMADLQSLAETRLNLKYIQRLRNQSRNATIPVEEVVSVMKIKREFSREQLSAKVLDFCGNISVYLVEEKVIPAKKGKSITKRNAITNHYLMNSASSGQKGLPNGYLTCKKPADHMRNIQACLNKNKKLMAACGLYPLTCRYQVTCNIATGTVIPQARSIVLRGTGSPATFIGIDVICVEQHKFTARWCCDVICP